MADDELKQQEHYVQSGSMTAMQVSEFGEPSVITPVSIAMPEAQAGEIVVKLYAAGVNPVDTYIRSGTYARKPELPYTPGIDGAGTVHALGAGVTSFSVGERVYVQGTRTGTYAQFAAAAVEQVFPLPDNISFEQGAAIGCAYSTAYRALFVRGSTAPGDTVLVHGASGGVGLAAVQLAVSRGVRVLATAGTERGAALVRAQGAAAVFNHRLQERYMEAVVEATEGGRGVDAVIEMLANVNLDADTRVLAVGGVIAVVGNRGTIEINPRELMAREASIFGVANARTTPKQAASTHAAIAAGLQSGALSPIVAVTLPLQSAAEAHVEVIEHTSGSSGKVVLSIPQQQ